MPWLIWTPGGDPLYIVRDPTPWTCVAVATEFDIDGCSKRSERVTLNSIHATKIFCFTPKRIFVYTYIRIYTFDN